MSQQHSEVKLAWDVADRMRKSLRVSGSGVQEMADYLGVARNTVSSWINGRIRPSRQTLILWAMRTGVTVAYLESGQTSDPEGGPDDGTSLPRAYSKRQPAGYLHGAGRPGWNLTSDEEITWGSRFAA